MINNWTIKNFKSVKGLNKLALSPLTIFAGANSSGKSTVLQSILLTAQTIQNSVSTKSLILNGHILRFGTFSDILTNGASERSILMGFEIEPLSEAQESEFSVSPRFFNFSYGLKTVKCEFSFTDQINEEASELLQLQPKLERTVLQARMQDEEQTFYDIEIVRARKSIEERIKDLKLSDNAPQVNQLQTLEYEVLKPLYYHSERRPKEGKYVGAYMDHFLPSSLSIVYDRALEEKAQFLEKLTGSSIYSSSSDEERLFNKFMNDNLKNQLLKFAEEVYEERKQSNLSVHEENRIIETLNIAKSDFKTQTFKRLKSLSSYGRSLIQKLDDNSSRIRSLLSTEIKEDYRLTSNGGYTEFSNYIQTFFKRNLKYLGPLRDEPKSVYPLSGTFDPRDIGFRGENTAAVLDVQRNTIIKYIPPVYFTDKSNNPILQTDTLMNAVLDWLEYMGIAEKVDTKDQGKLGHELKIATLGSENSHDLTHVGVGVSQVLPILVLSLLAEVDSTLIFEQPELHLHPKVQTRLADFFVSIVMAKKQCLVETHSEYLINRLRYQIAVYDDDELSQMITMYFVEKEEQASQYRKVKINQYGVIENWPKGFFDENEENAAAILRAAMAKKNKSKH